MACLQYVVSYLKSNWVASDLPIIVGIESDKYPINSNDPTDTVASVSNQNGYARITITSPITTYSKGSYVTLTGDTVTGYNNVFRVRNVFGSGDIVLDAPFLGNDTGTIQRYYSNYEIVLNVYAGIRPGHTLEANRPMRLVGQVSERPGLNNVANIDISSLIRPDLSPVENNYCDLDFTNGWANDWNQFTQFYFQFAERYDIVSNSVLTTYTSPFTTETDSAGNINYYSVAKAANSFQYSQGKSMSEFAMNAANYDGAGRFMTNWALPTYFEGREWDVSIINDYQNDDITLPHLLNVREYDRNGAILSTTQYALPEEDEGVYRWSADAHLFDGLCKTFDLYVTYGRDGSAYNTQSLTCKYVNECGNQGIYLKWLNQVGGWDSWLFTRYVDKTVDIQSRGLVRRNIFNNYDTGFVFGTTQDDYTNAIAFERRAVSSQILSESEAEQLGKWLRLSTKVQEIYRETDTDCGNDVKRTILCDQGSFTYLSDSNKIRTVILEYRYTDQIIVPSQ